MTLRTVLVTVTGPDAPGISENLFGTLGELDACVLNIEQISVRRRLTMNVLIETAHNDAGLKPLQLFGFQHDMTVLLEDVEQASTTYREPHVITIVGPELGPPELSRTFAAIAAGGANIDRIVRLSKYPVMSYEMSVSGGRIHDLKTNLLQAAADHDGLDVAIQPFGLSRRAKRLVVLDVDSTLIQDEVIVLLAQEAGTADEVSRITESAMRGELDFEESLRSRVKTLAGLDELSLERAWRNLTLTSGARTFVRTLGRLGYTTAIVSGGFTIFTDRLQKELGINRAHANELEIQNGRLTGQIVGDVVDRAAKAVFLAEVAEQEGIPIEQTVAVGDGANDLDMIAAAGLGIAFNAKQVVREAADTALRVPYLDAVLFLLGVSREEIEHADRDRE